MSTEKSAAAESGRSDAGVAWEIGPDGIAEILFDTPGSKVNLIRTETLGALEEAIAFLARRGGVTGVLLASGKPGVFIAGADVNQIAAVDSEKEAQETSTAGQRVFNHLAALPFPTAAAISGACLGGGLEMALACDLRLAADAEAVRIGLPEVRLGIIPAWGGTQRLPALVPLPAALDLILSGRTLSARQARRLGLVDEVVPPERLRAAARRRVAAAAAGAVAIRAPRAARDRLLLIPPIRSFILGRAAASVRKRTGGHYPAPLAAIEAIRRGLEAGTEAGLRCEAEKVGSLLAGDVSRNLLRIFRASRRDPKGAPGERGREVQRAGILGAGVMGGAIGAVAAGKGVAVRLRDVGPRPLEKGLAHAHAILGGRRRSPSWTESRFIRIAPTLDLNGFARSDLILEAVIEDLDLKRRVLAEAEKVVPAECVLATNTSSLSIDGIASALQAPDRFIGLHFFNPAERMPLVEVVRGSQTDSATVATALAFARKLGKTPVLVSDAPGFVVNRLLMPYLSEALQVVAGGAEVEAIDRSMVRFGMPIGPLALLDQIGLDVAAKVAGVLAAAFGDRLPSPAGLQALAGAGLLGAKGGAGFYLHRGRKRQVNARAVEILRSSRGPGDAGAGGKVPEGERLSGRLLHPVINEAARLLEEGVAASAEIVDLAMVLGTGFPPFRGGPLRWADATGVPSIVASLAEMAAGGAGDHLAPSEALERAAAGAGRFHTDR